MANYINCSEISAQCPITSTIYGYTPSLPANATLLAVFSLVLIVQLGQGVAWQTWGFMVAFGIGSLCEVIGYAGRLMLHSNAWNHSGLLIQMICLTIGPLFYSAGIYLCYLQLVESFKPTSSRINPIAYPLIAASCNTLPFLLQISGAILAANTIRNGTDSKTGSHLMIAGFAFQIVTMLLFAILCFDFGIRAHLNRHSLTSATKTIRSLKRFRFFWVALAYCYVLIMIRCIYRVAELSQETLLKNETAFIALEGVMVAAAGYAMCLVHPGYVFGRGSETDMEVLEEDEKAIL